MDRLQASKIENYFEFLLLISLLVIVFFLVRSFFLALLFAGIFTFIFYKQYLFLLEKTQNKNFSAAIICIIVLLILLVPVYFVITTLVDETSFMIESTEVLLKDFQESDCKTNFCETIKKGLNFSDSNVNDYLERLLSYFAGTFSDIFDSLTKLAINFSIFILALFFFLIDGEKFIKYIKRVIPLKREHKNALFLRFREVSSAVFAGSLLVATIQGILLGIGFYLFGLPSPIFWTLITTFFALIPVIGTAIVWIPVVFYFIITAQYLQAVLFFFWGGVIVGLSDNIIRPYFIRRKIEVHPFLILLSILGGIEVFGLLGIFIGPIVIALLISLLHLYHLNFS